MPNGNDLGLFIKRRREELGLTQDDVGQKIGLSRARVGQLERGRVTWPGPEVFGPLAAALEIPVIDLLRAAGLRIPITTHEELAWLTDQMDEEGANLLVTLGRAILPQHRRRPGTVPQ